MGPAEVSRREPECKEQSLGSLLCKMALTWRWVGIWPSLWPPTSHQTSRILQKAPISLCTGRVIPTKSPDLNRSLGPWAVGGACPSSGVVTPSGLALLLHLWARPALGSE